MVKKRFDIELEKIINATKFYYLIISLFRFKKYIDDNKSLPKSKLCLMNIVAARDTLNVVIVAKNGFIFSKSIKFNYN